MKKYSRNAGSWNFMEPRSKLPVLAILLFIISGTLLALKKLVPWWIERYIPIFFYTALGIIGYAGIVSGVVLLVCAVLSPIFPKSLYITLLVKRALFEPSRGNPLHLKEGQYLPTVCCKRNGPEQGEFLLKISTEGFTPEQIKNLGSVISPALTGRVKNYAVTKVRETMSRNHVEFVIEDMTVDHRLIFKSVEEMLFPPLTKLHVDKRTDIDLTTSGSIICAGKTRSGKTTGINY